MIIQWQVTRLQEAQIEPAGAALARAFTNDPLGKYMFPDGADRERLLPWYFSTFTRYGYLFGEVYTTDQAEGAAIWLPPNDQAMTPERIEQAGLHEAPIHLGAAAWERFSRFMDAMELFHERDVRTSHWYLALLGVDKSRQGQGLGSALLAPILARADKERLVCYLETFEASNVSFYQRQGFAIVVEDVEPHSGIRFWTFKREPQ